MMKLVLVAPPVFTTEEGIYPPLGLISIATYVKAQTNIMVEIQDLAFNIFASDIAISENLYAELASGILNSKPDIVGISVQNISLSACLNLSEKIKEMNRNIIVVFGGPGVDGIEIKLLTLFPQVDYIVRGEGEITLTELILALRNKNDISTINGVVRRDSSGEIVFNKDRLSIDDLDVLPPPDLSMVNSPELYSKVAGFLETSVNVELARGCGGRCTFCGCSSFWGGARRTFSPKKVVEHIVDVVSMYNVKHICLSDDNFLANSSFASDFCDELINKNVSITWDTRGRVSSLTEELLKKLRDARCSHILIGIESTSAELLSSYNKNINPEYMHNKIVQVMDSGVFPVLSFILGHPLETKEMLHETLVFLCRLFVLNKPLAAHFHIMSLVPGTTLYKREVANLDVKTRIYRFRNYKVGNSKMLYSDVRLIEKYPELFSSFYNVTTTYIDIILLEFISKFFVALLRTYSCTFYLMNLREINYVILLGDFLEYFNNSDNTWHSFDNDMKDTPNIVNRLFFRFVKENVNHEDVLEMLTFEFELYNASNTISDSSTTIETSHNIISYRRNLRKNDNFHELPSRINPSIVKIVKNNAEVSIYGAKTC